MASFMIFAAVAAAISLLLICPMSAEGHDITELVKQEIFDRENEWLGLFKNRSYEAMCNELYTEDCVVYLPGDRRARGREECARAWEAIKKEDYNYAGYFLTPIIEKVIVTSGGYVIERSNIETSEHQQFQYMDVWKRIGGKLYIFHNIASPSTHYRELTCTLLEEITDRRNEIAYYFNTGNFASASRRFTPDCWVAPSGMPPVTGRDGYEKLMVKTAVSGVARLILIPEQNEVFDIGDDYVLNHGAWIKYDEAGVELDHGKDMTIWKRLEDGQLYIHFDMWNSDIHF